MSGDGVLHADVGIVGAGPGGMAAARALGSQGLAVTVLDEGARPGGQIFRQPPAGFRVEPSSLEAPSHREGHALIHELEGSPVRVVHGATVWDCKPGHVWFEHEGRSRLLRGQAVLLAPGAYDRCLPFPGWTLPGVMTAGAAQVMVRGFCVKPGDRALVAGSGPLLLPTVTALLSAGVEVVAALEACGRFSVLRAIPAVLRSGSRRREARHYGKALLTRGVRLRHGWTVFEARGDDRVRSAVIGKLDRDGRPRRSTAREIEVNLVCTGFGLVPAIELAQLGGCEIGYDAVRGGYMVASSDAMQTSVSGIFVAGEIAGVGGAQVAMVEGELAAHAILFKLRGMAIPEALLRRRRVERAAADAMLAAFPQRPGLFELAGDDTIVCRCEDVTLAQVRQAAGMHGADARGIKMGCRAGMGACQGRICGPSVEALANAEAREKPASRPVAQVPAKPVSVRTVLDAPVE